MVMAVTAALVSSALMGLESRKLNALADAIKAALRVAAGMNDLCESFMGVERDGAENNADG